MKKALLASVIGLTLGGGFAVPQLANAAGSPPPYTGSNCPSTAGPVGVLTSGTQAAVCAEGLPTSVVGFSGGAVAAGATTSNGTTRVCGPTGAIATPVPVGVYVVADGSDANTISNSTGYIGVSNYESSSTAAPAGCPTTTDADAGNGGSNSGGYVGVKGVAYAPVPFVVCGFSSGPDFGNAGRDGCAIP